MTIENHIQSVSTRLKSGILHEHSYRGDLESLIRELVKDVEIRQVHLLESHKVEQYISSYSIDGYKPAQKWLKGRKNRELKFEDILHYQKIIVTLSETDRIMEEIDKIEIE